MGTLLSQTACAHASITNRSGLFRGSDLSPATLDQLADTVVPGTVVVIGENHGVTEHRDQQVAILNELRSRRFVVSVGLEFFPWTSQADVDAWRAGRLPESEFLSRIGWGEPSFDFYRPQALFPRLTEGALTLAINAPRALTGHIAKGGLESLSSEERALMPPEFTMGSEPYRRRFAALMPHDPSSPKFQNYFVAQSVWDDTMAWRAAGFVAGHPDQVLVIVVGDFHVAYGGGLPDRLRARGVRRVLTVSQVNLGDFPDGERAGVLQPSSQDGPRADFIWLKSPDSGTLP